MNERTNECMNVWIYEGRNERTNEWMNEWTNEERNEWVNEGAPRPFDFSTFCSGSRAVAIVLCTFCGNFCSSRPTTAETETLLQRPQEALYQKKHRVSRPRVFSPVNSHASELLHVPSGCKWFTWWCGWHDNVADMMRHEHDDKTTPGHSSVTLKFSN